MNLAALLRSTYVESLCNRVGPKEVAVKAVSLCGYSVFGGLLINE